MDVYVRLRIIAICVSWVAVGLVVLLASLLNVVDGRVVVAIEQQSHFSILIKAWSHRSIRFNQTEPSRLCRYCWHESRTLGILQAPMSPGRVHWSMCEKKLGHNWLNAVLTVSTLFGPSYPNSNSTQLIWFWHFLPHWTKIDWVELSWLWSHCMSRVVYSHS